MKDFAEFQVIILFSTLLFLLNLKIFKPVQTSPVSRIGTLEDIAGLLSYLASKDSLMLTGAFLINIAINHSSFPIKQG